MLPFSFIHVATLITFSVATQWTTLYDDISEHWSTVPSYTCTPQDNATHRSLIITCNAVNDQPTLQIFNNTSNCTGELFAETYYAGNVNDDTHCTAAECQYSVIKRYEACNNVGDYDEFTVIVGECIPTYCNQWVQYECNDTAVVLRQYSNSNCTGDSASTEGYDFIEGTCNDDNEYISITSCDMYSETAVETSSSWFMIMVAIISVGLIALCIGGCYHDINHQKVNSLFVSASSNRKMTRVLPVTPVTPVTPQTPENDMNTENEIMKVNKNASDGIYKTSSADMTTILRDMGTQSGKANFQV